jgi:penicillin-binding protein 1C
MRWLRRAVVAAIAPPALFFASFYLAVAFWTYPKDAARMPTDATYLCDIQNHPLAQFAAPDDQWRLTLAEPEISPHLLAAIQAAEDARFHDHHGVDWKSAFAALWQDASSLRLKRGGSTITMQLHRLRQPVPHTLFGKFEQAVRATQIEKQQAKQQTLVEYLNRAPFGGNLTGAGAASWRYFARPCRDLSLAQAALLAGLPKNPNNDRPDRFPQRAKSRRNFILARMLSLGMIDKAAYAQALAEPIDAAWHPLPQRNHPAIESAFPTLTRLAQQSSGGQIRTTLDLRLQQIATSVAQDHLRQQGGQISELAVVIVDTATANCVAAVSLSQSGVNAIDLTQRPRSTGSVIKPLIYAAAFDAAIASPQSMLDDSPAAWPGYAPHNYDEQFRGRMTAADALAQSRNIPALKLLSQVGVERAVGICAAMGLQTIARTPQRYGLSLAIGGAEATPVEVAQAYTALANHGVHRDLKWIAGASEPNHALLASASHSASLSPRACDDVLACISDPHRTAEICPEAAPLRPAWKTGTSSGHRDAWCAVVGPAHVIVVWMGNANATGATSIVGAEAAAPLALQLIASIDAQIPPAPAAPQPMPVLALSRSPQPQLAITSPVNRSVIIRLPDQPASRQRLQLRATLTHDQGTPASLYWYLDGALAGVSTTGQSLWCQPPPGHHEARVIDQAGNADKVEFDVKDASED